MDLSKIDMDRLIGDVSKALADGISDLVEGAEEDVQRYAKAISDDMLIASLAGDEDLRDQLIDQLKLLAEINRIRVENHTWTVVASVTKAIFEAAVAGVLAVLL